MESNWAAQNLQTIRTLMERSALYRRALAPIMLLAGSLGIIGATIPCFTPIESNHSFSLYWLSVSLLTFAATFYLARRQALKVSEPLWSPPTRRVTQALTPPFCVGLLAGALLLVSGSQLPPLTWVLSPVWIITYGLALHSAGFFMERGIKFFGWLFAFGGAGFLALSALTPSLQSPEVAHYSMGVSFGALHLAYGIYLYFTEKRRRSP